MNDILCPTDFTPAGDAAMLIGAAIAARRNASVTLLHVLDKDHEKNEVLGSARTLLDNAEERVKKMVSTRSIFREGDFLKEIAEEAGHGHALMVVGTHGVKGLRQSLFGADILKLVRKVSIPSLVVQDRTPTVVSFKRIIMPVAGHDDITSLMDPVCMIAKLFDSEVQVYQLMRPGEQPSDQLLENKRKMLYRLDEEKIAHTEVNEPAHSFSIGFAGHTIAYAHKVDATMIAIMAKPSEDYRHIADAEKERLLLNDAFIPVLCAV